ncbi:putative lipid II flippase FtsW [Candidatus Shapirobacteria bacterium CG08_land_8_20_14_0_20_39_18]|uniref:Probable peptidoglycan glycosyltransferase FtsW n=1 Tax=Candidatus Shapirobacteria bacterium CG08_land_8_20_14_0_20_39_18 TaxID=1974883 RepID=A0A2M6XBV6_9BACT|nr:MAG: putative lipid II flippase FtsW [Candidatus Shapirobacteria bacterium CG08_land_8_20_14_0_20_39_18]PIY65343.1 MAG: putative lipid II flippase FtsW [Candidatus Shapirobacteria bacterium CG_4_10_14_0_8_um_filter_39_15]PJE68194.1 MAG: putative lipid II flippase FtsW [Candidatus Shapirobacteria bacterium CG10_big_fil_rev_8_21_14_0_10_38_8]
MVSRDLMAQLKPQIRRIDILLFYLTVALSIFGVLMIFEASSVTAFQDFGDKYYYIRQQIIWIIIGFISLAIFSKINYQVLRKISPILILATIGFLILVLVPGIGIKLLGARRWINLGFFGFQPAELVKLSLVIYLSSVFTSKSRFLPLIFVLGLLNLLILLEPDLGTAVIISITGFILYFVSGAPLLSLIGFITSSLIGGIILIISSSYRRARLLTFFDPNRDPLGSSYHLHQILLALGSGGLFGVGIGASRQKYAYLPEATTDSIFAVIAEELGFIGALVLIGLFLIIIWRGFKIAVETPDRFGQLLAVGITSWIGIQMVVNLAAMVSLIPLTGVPLPFVSYGGSSLVINLAGIGILLNISRQRVVK